MKSSSGERTCRDSDDLLDEIESIEDDLRKANGMRGPGYKLSGDVRRTWRCPLCGRERKLQGDVTSLMCGCRENSWMQIVAERILAPRPLQRPSDLERRPIDFGIEPAAPVPAKPEATIIKPAIARDPEPVPDEVPETPEADAASKNDHPADHGDEWGEGIL